MTNRQSDVDFYYILSSKYGYYVDSLHAIGIDEGDYKNILREVTNNPHFCRDSESIEYWYFLELVQLSSKRDLCIYIEDQQQIVGCCIISIENNEIIIWGLCVPVASPKKYGSLILNKIKEFGKKAGLKLISLSAHKSVLAFYTKNGFAPSDEDEDYERESIPMKYSLLSGGSPRFVVFMF